MKKIALFVCLAMIGALLLTNTRAMAAADETGGLERKTRTPGARATEQALDVTPEPPD